MFLPAWRHEDKTIRYRFCIYILYSNRNFRPTLLAVLGIQDVKPGSRFFDIQDPGSWISEVFLTVKFIKKSSQKHGLDLGFGIRDLGSGKKRIPDPGSISTGQKTLYPGSWVWISNSASAWLSYGSAWLSIVRRGLIWCAVA